MAAGARMRPSQLQQIFFPVKCIKAGVKHLLWTSLVAIFLFGGFLSHVLLHSPTVTPGTPTRFVFPRFGRITNETILRYSLFNPAVNAERERIKFVLKAIDFGRIRLKQFIFPSNQTGRKPRSTRITRQERDWMLPFATRAFEPYIPKFVELSKTWVGEDDDFNPRVMQDLVQTVKGPLDGNAAAWSRNAGKAVNMSNWGKRYPSCAVVGNSGVLLNGNHGEAIDSHEMVIRLNNAEIYPYVKHVGSKTTLSFVNSNILRSCSVRPDCWCQTYGEEVPIILYICQANHLIQVSRCMPKHEAPLLVTHSLLDGLSAAIVKWYSVTNFMQTTGRPASQWDSVHHEQYFHYSSGMEAVVLALGLCDSVDLFGFGKFDDAKHHYHTQQKEELSLHDYAAEYLFYDDLIHNRTIPFLSVAGIFIPPVRIFY